MIMTLENQTSSIPTNKAVVAAIMTILVFHFSSGFVPVEVLGAYAIIVEYVIAVIGGLLAAYSIRDRAGTILLEDSE